MFKKNDPAQIRFIKDLWKVRYYSKKLMEIRMVRLFIIILGLFLLLPVPVFVLLRPKVQENISYGVTFSNKYSQELGLDWKDTYIKILDDLGVKKIRIVAYWDEIETTPDNFNYENIEWQLEEAQKRNVEVMLSLGRKVPRYPECFEPSWWKKIEDEHFRDLELYEYIKRTIVELRSYHTIKIWQVENEPYWPFGECTFPFNTPSLKKEINIVRNLDPRPIIVQDSGEGGLWASTYRLGDKLGISMYRKIWYDFWGIFLKKFIYFQYPLAHWTYKIKADLVNVPYRDIIVTELQAEPWGPGRNSELSTKEKNKTMSRTDFIDTLNYANKAGFNDYYLWGVEWWLWEKEMNNNPYFWDTAKPLFR